MQIAHGDMWSAWDQADLFLVTTNAARKKNGALVMGKGIALDARDRFPGLALALGQQLSAQGHLTHHSAYGLLVSPEWPAKKLGLFQVKYHYRQGAELALIRLSTSQLLAWCNIHPEAQVHLNYPGIGAGGLDEGIVHEVIQALPEAVHVWKHAL